jgi:micrococcal nuclease
MLRLLLLLLLLTQPAQAQLQQLRVSDGDTLRIGDTRIRLACIDAPESDQPWGSQSKARLRDLLESQVQVQVLDTDRYGRSIAKLWSDNTLIQEQLVREGLAWVYPQFLHRCPTTATRLIQAEQQAKTERRGLWADPNPIPPWVWRRR